MEEKEKIDIIEEKPENRSERNETEHSRHHHKSSHHGSGHHHGSRHGYKSGSHHSEGKRPKGKDSQKKVVKDRMREVRWEKFFKPILRVVFVVFLIALVIMIVWSLVSPNQEVKQAVKRDTDVAETVKTEIHIEELQAEIESLKEELEEYEEKIYELEEKLAEYGGESSVVVPEEEPDGESENEPPEE